MNLFTLQRLLGVLMLASVFALAFSPDVCLAQDAPEATTEVDVTEVEVEETPALGMDYALNTILLFLSGVLVFIMQAGFAMVESGLNSAKNAVNILFKNTMDICVGVLLYFFIGFGLMYPGNYGVDVAEKPYFAFGGVGLDGYSGGTLYSPAADWFFQAMFAATAATIVSGAVAGRMKIGAYLIYSAVITAFVYPISGYWKWGGGWLMQFENGMKFQDFAGSAVVHGVGGFAALAGAWIIGPRLGRFVAGKSVPLPGHSLPLVALGVFILWFGWYGFNPGSQLAFADAASAQAVTRIAVTTTLAAGAGGLVATLLSWAMFGKPDLSLGLNGILAGLVSITACCDCMTYEMSILVGAIGAVIVILATMMLEKLQIDDPVGAFPVHGMCGIWACLAIGILPNSHTTQSVAEKFAGAPIEDFVAKTDFMTQLIGTAAICGWSFVTMLALFAIMKAAGILRVSAEDEQAGLDISEHGMQAYGSH